MMWVSDDGAVTVRVRQTHMRVELDVGLSVPAYKRPRHGPTTWVGQREHDDAIDFVVVVEVEDGDEMVVGHARLRPFAAGTEADPRAEAREWTCARVVRR